MFWIDHIPFEKADSSLKKIYNRIKGPNNKIDNILMVHSLRPHTLTGHMSLYKNVLHNTNNTLPTWYLEALGVYVSFLNQCDYCVDHHFAGLQKLWNDPEKSKEFYKALKQNSIETFFDKKWSMGFTYANLLSKNPIKISKKNIQNLKDLGFSDGEILEINQVVSYFNYANRTVLGLGVNIHGDVLGLSPNDSENAENWNHQ